jgi:hypothetical protein
MGIRHPNHRLVKKHLTYSVEEVSNLLGPHRNTVREWLRNGLQVIDRRRPQLIHGKDLVAFLLTRRRSNKRPLRPGQLYCLKCREGKVPRGNAVVYQAQTPRLGNLVGVCPDCETRMFRRVNPVKMAQVVGQLTVTMPQALEHINESDQPSVNSDFKKDASDHD